MFTRIAQALRPGREVARLREVVLDLGQALTDLTANQTAALAMIKLLEVRLYGPGEPTGEECCGPEPVTQRDLDDAAAGLIRDARREATGSGER